MSQHKYIMGLLHKFHMTECEPVPTPQAKSAELQKETTLTPAQIAAQPFDFRGLVGSLMFLVRGKRPDIANAVRELSKFLSCCNKMHYRAAQSVLKYLKGTSTYGLLYDGMKKEIAYELYTAGSFGNTNEQSRLVTGYVSIMAQSFITWRCAKQDTVSVNTPQSELIAPREGVKENE